MFEHIIFPEFRDQYANTRYPFADDASLRSDAGQQLDLDIFLDASLYPIGASPGLLYMSGINIEPRLVTISFADRSRKTRATATFDPLDPPDNLKVVDSFGRPAGILVSEAIRLSRFSSWPFGMQTFSPQNARLVPSCVIPTPEVGVRGLSTDKGGLLAGDVAIVGENGVVVREDSPGVIRVDVVGDVLFRRKLCNPLSLFSTPRFIKTINGCPPDKYGNFNITVGDHFNPETIIRIYTTDAGLTIEAIGNTVQRTTK